MKVSTVAPSATAIDAAENLCKKRDDLPSVQKRNRDKHGRLLSVWEQLDLERTGSNAPMCM